MSGGNILIKGGLLITPSASFKADIKVIDGKIVEIGTGLSNAGVEEVLDVSGMYVFPGIVDEHVHMREPGLEYKDDFTHGTAGAAVGGVTTVLEMPNTKPPVESAAIFEEKRRLLSQLHQLKWLLKKIILL
jgi:allantoinase